MINNNIFNENEVKFCSLYKALILKLEEINTCEHSYVAVTFFSSECELYTANVYSLPDGRKATLDELKREHIQVGCFASISICSQTNSIDELTSIEFTRPGQNTVLQTLSRALVEESETKYKVITNILKGTSDKWKTDCYSEAPTLCDLALEFYHRHHDDIVFSSATGSIQESKINAWLDETYDLVLLSKAFSNLDSDLLIAATALHRIGILEDHNPESPYNASSSLSECQYLSHDHAAKMLIDRIAHASNKYNLIRVGQLEDLILRLCDIDALGHPQTPTSMEGNILKHLIEVQCNEELALRHTDSTTRILKMVAALFEKPAEEPERYDC